MTLEEFNSLTDSEKQLTLDTFDLQTVNTQKALDDAEAEKNSFKEELEQLKADYQELLQDNKKTKELNFTLGRKLNVENKKQDAEEILHNMFTKGGE